MSSASATLYRAVLRELRQSIEPPRRVNRTIIAHFRTIAEKVQTKNGDVQAKQDFENAINFLRAQREHKRLLDKYNPLFDLTSQQRVAATANRVGLNMPKIFQE